MWKSVLISADCPAVEKDCTHTCIYSCLKMSSRKLNKVGIADPIGYLFLFEFLLWLNTLILIKHKANLTSCHFYSKPPENYFHKRIQIFTRKHLIKLITNDFVCRWPRGRFVSCNLLKGKWVSWGKVNSQSGRLEFCYEQCWEDFSRGAVQHSKALISSPSQI